jgi:3-hydroxy acid dehydrogenase/malonic semialdehyde reductase
MAAPSAAYPKHTPGTALITGATGDFGKATAKRFAALGCPLILTGRTPEKLEKLKAEIGALNDNRIHTLCLDMKNHAALETSLKSLPANYAQIDILINNAGGALGLDPAHKADLNDWQAMIDVNVTALAILTRLILPGMVERKSGHIINIGSVAGTYAYPGGNVYGAAKAFVKQFSLNLRADLAGTNIRVTNIEPGMVETKFSLTRFKGDKTRAEAVYAKTTPLTAEDIAESIVWVATLPTHVNVNSIEIMPTKQSFGPLAVERAS